MNPKNISYIKLEQLKLDAENPRLPSSFKKNPTTQEDIINWMLQDASIIELMLAIGRSGFFIGESLLVVKDNDSEIFTVIEGNRRLTSVMLLNHPEIAKVHKKQIEKVLEESPKKPTELPCIVFDKRSEVNQYLGYRHVTGVKSWGALSKARYLNELLGQVQGTTLLEKCRELAKAIGSRSDHVRKLLVSYWIFEIVEDAGFFNIVGLNELSLHFNYFTDSLSKEHIRKFIKIDVESDDPIKNINIDNLKIITKWFFEKNEHGQSRVLGNSEQLGMLNEVLSNKDADPHPLH